jgi:hypothetical protein
MQAVKEEQKRNRTHIVAFHGGVDKPLSGQPELVIADRFILVLNISPISNLHKSGQE